MSVNKNRQVALTDEARLELGLLAMDLGSRCRRRLTLSEAIMVAAEIVTDASDEVIYAAADVHAKRA